MSEDYSLNESFSAKSSASSGSSIDESDRGSQTTSESESNKERIQKSRCRSEKKRRDKLNLFVRDLQKMLSPSFSKRLDKSTVLKMTVDYLKIHNDLSVNMNGKGKLSKSFFLPCEELGQIMLEILNGFIIVINEDAKFVYVADVAEKILGVKSSCLIEKTIYALIHKDDHQKVTNELMAGAVRQEMAGVPVSTMSVLNDQHLTKNTVKLNFRILIEKDNCEPEYRALACTGKWYSLRDKGGTPCNDNWLVLLACVEKCDLRPIAPDPSTCTSFSSKNSLDGSFLFADTNCSAVTGYLPYELLGKSLYSFVHNDDLMELCKIHEKITKGTSSETETVYFRFRSKGEEWVLFRVELRLVLKPGAAEPDHIFIQFTLANSQENHEFRSFMKSKAFRIEDYLPGIFNKNEKSNAEMMEKNQRNSLPSDVDQFQKIKVGEKTGKTMEKVSSPVPSNQSNVSMLQDFSPEQSEVSTDQEVDETDQEQFFEAQKHLHNQLTEKHDLLCKSYKKQKEQLDNIEATMLEYRYFMQAPSFKSHYEQQVEMFEYFTYMLKKQQRRQEYLSKLLKGKIKELEIRQRAIKLRQMASRQQKALTRMKEANEEQRNSQQANSSDSHYQVAKDFMSSSFATSSPMQGIVSGSGKPSCSSSFVLKEPASSSFGVSRRQSLNCFPSTCSPCVTAIPPVDTTVTPASRSNTTLGVDILQSQLEQLQQIQKQHAQLQPQVQTQKNLNDGVGRNQQNKILQLNQLRQQLHNQLPESEKSCETQQELVKSQCPISPFQFNGLTQPVMTPVEAQDTRIESRSSPEMELQSMISKQILVHLQILQKHVLNQLQSVIQDKRETKTDSKTDFSQVLPVLQQLQQLQQSIIEQQQQNQQQRHSTCTVSKPSSNNEPDMTNNRLNSVSSSPQAQVNLATNSLFLPEENNIEMLNSLTDSNNNSQENASPNNVQKDVSVFGDLNATKLELNNIKNTFSYPEENNDSQKLANDCFPDLPSPELRSLMFSDFGNNEQNNNDTNNNSNGNEDDDLKKRKEVDQENLSSLQPLMENQQLLAQLQQHQRMQIFMQQQEQLQAIQSQAEGASEPCDVADQRSRTQMTPMNQELANNEREPNNNNPESLSASLQNAFDQENASGNFAGQNLNELISWIPPENEEVLNMLLSEGDLFW